MEHEENTYAKTLRITGAIIILCGILASLILGKTLANGYNEINWVIVIGGIISSIISGIIFQGFSEIINLMQIQTDTMKELNNKLDHLDKKTDSQNTTNKTN